MVDRKSSRSLRLRRILLVGALLTVALALTCPTNSTAVQPKRVSPQPRGPAPQSRVTPAKMTNGVSKPRPSPNFHRDMMPLEEGQKGLQRQLESLTGMTQRRTDILARRIDSMAEQLFPLSSAIQQVTGTQQLLTATVRSMRAWLMIIMGLLLIVCIALVSLAYELKQLARPRLRDRKEIESAGGPDETFDPQWKVSS